MGKLSSYNAATTLTGAEIIPIVQGGSNKKMTPDLLLQGINNKALSKYLYYGMSMRKSGLTVTYSGAADNYTVAAGSALLNGREYQLGVAQVGGLKAITQLSESGKSYKDPFILKDGDIWYMFYDVKTDGQNGDTIDIAYATSADCRVWANHGIIIQNTDCWGAGNGGAWAPCVIKEGNIWYMFICNEFNKIGYLTSSNLISWTWGGVVKDSLGVDLVGIDADVVLYNGVYYMTIAEVSGTDITMYSASFISSNAWVSEGILLTKGALEGIIEAPTLVIGSPFVLFYGVNGSDVCQRISIAIADNIKGPYIKAGVYGQVLLDFPGVSIGSISHPTAVYDKINGTWFLYACTGTQVSGHDGQSIIGYFSSDLQSWQPISTTSQLVASQTNYLYINPSGQIIHSTDLPTPAYIVSFTERVGYLLLGSLTVDGSRQVTAFNEYIAAVINIADNPVLKNMVSLSIRDGSGVKQDILNMWSNNIIYLGSAAGNVMKIRYSGSNTIPLLQIEDGFIGEFLDLTGVMLKHVAKIATGTATAAKTFNITLNIPTGAKLLSVALSVITALTSSDGGTTWSAAYSGGNASAIVTGIALTKNSKANAIFNEFAASAITTNTTQITITCDATKTFIAGGQVRATIYYLEQGTSYDV